MSEGPMTLTPELQDIAARLQSEQPTPPETIRVASLDKHAHLRRTVEDLYADQQRGEAALRLHQRTLQRHAELHKVQANAREELRRKLEARIKAVEKHADNIDAAQLERLEPLHRGFLGRVRWLFTGL